MSISFSSRPKSALFIYAVVVFVCSYASSLESAGKSKSARACATAIDGLSAKDGVFNPEELLRSRGIDPSRLEFLKQEEEGELFIAVFYDHAMIGYEIVRQGSEFEAETGQSNNRDSGRVFDIQIEGGFQKRNLGLVLHFIAADHVIHTWNKKSFASAEDTKMSTGSMALWKKIERMGWADSLYNDQGAEGMLLNDAFFASGAMEAARKFFHARLIELRVAKTYRASGDARVGKIWDFLKK